MAEYTRRSFLSRGSVGAAGAIGALSAGPAALAAAVGGGAAAADAELSADELDTLSGPLFVHVRDAAAGEIEVLVDDTSVVFNDKALVAKVLRAGK